jgi:hypothetical protein
MTGTLFMLEPVGQPWPLGITVTICPVWVLLGYGGTPQWGTRGEHRADYPTVRLFRLSDHGGRWPALYARSTAAR